MQQIRKELRGVAALVENMESERQLSTDISRLARKLLIRVSGFHHIEKLAEALPALFAHADGVMKESIQIVALAVILEQRAEMEHDEEERARWYRDARLLVGRMLRFLDHLSSTRQQQSARTKGRAIQKNGQLSVNKPYFECEATISFQASPGLLCSLR